MVLIEELSRGPLLDISGYYYDTERQHRYASKASEGSSSYCLEEEEQKKKNTNDYNHDHDHHEAQHHHYPVLLALVPVVTLLYMAACDNLRSNSDVFVFSLGVLSYVIGMDLILSKTMGAADVFVE